MSLPSDYSAIVPYVAPESLTQSDNWMQEIEVLQAQRNNEKTLGDCPICLCPLDCGEEDGVKDNDDDQAAAGNDNDVLRLRCDHHFHRQCLKLSMEKHKPVCPTCRKPFQEPRGSCPSGTMQIDLLQGCPCPGFDPTVDTLQIHYNLPSGTQKSYHYHPGVRFHGTSRTAYLPWNQEGKDLLDRLVFAWKHGLNFTVGTSLTTHIPNSVVWTSIHHKTSLHGGPHGWPDPGYVYNCNESLDALYVPDAESCRALEAANGAGASAPPQAPLSPRRRRSSRRSQRSSRGDPAPSTKTAATKTTSTTTADGSSGDDKDEHASNHKRKTSGNGVWKGRLRSKRNPHSNT